MFKEHKRFGTRHFLYILYVNNLFSFPPPFFPAGEDSTKKVQTNKGTEIIKQIKKKTTPHQFIKLRKTRPIFGQFWFIRPLKKLKKYLFLV